MGVVEIVNDCLVQELTFDLFLAAVSISHRFGLSHWDGAILAAARACGCGIVYAEDLSAEQDYDGTRVVDPFAQARTS